MTKKRSQSKKIDYFEAQKIHRKRTERAQKIDESKTAKKKSLEPTKAWMREPSKSDIIGIDTKKYKAQNIKQVAIFLKSTFVKVDKTLLEDSDFHFKDKDKALVTISSRTSKETTVKNLQDKISLRFNNVSIRPRKARKGRNDFWIVLKK